MHSRCLPDTPHTAGTTLYCVFMSEYNLNLNVLQTNLSVCLFLVALPAKMYRCLPPASWTPANQQPSDLNHVSCTLQAVDATLSFPTSVAWNPDTKELYITELIDGANGGR